MKNSLKSKIEIVQKGLACRQAGFTLIELLIVIVILGILATAVLVAINPMEQIGRGKDAGRINSVSQIGHAVQSFYTSQNKLPGDAAIAAWATDLTTAQELKAIPTAPTATVNGWAACGTNNVNGYCFAMNATKTEGVLFTQTESLSNRTKANSCATNAYAVWYSKSGKTGLVCDTEANIAGSADTPLTQY